MAHWAIFEWGERFRFTEVVEAESKEEALRKYHVQRREELGDDWEECSPDAAEVRLVERVSVYEEHGTGRRYKVWDVQEGVVEGMGCAGDSD